MLNLFLEFGVIATLANLYKREIPNFVHHVVVQLVTQNPTQLYCRLIKLILNTRDETIQICLDPETWEPAQNGRNRIDHSHWSISEQNIRQN